MSSVLRPCSDVATLQFVSLLLKSCCDVATLILGSALYCDVMTLNVNVATFLFSILLTSTYVATLIT